MISTASNAGWGWSSTDLSICVEEISGAEIACFSPTLSYDWYSRGRWDTFQDWLVGILRNSFKSGNWPDNNFAQRNFWGFTRCKTEKISSDVSLLSGIRLVIVVFIPTGWEWPFNYESQLVLWWFYAVVENIYAK